MAFGEIYLAQLTDLFRIGLLVALLVTSINTAAQLQRWIPLGLGVVFVAILIPLTLTAESPVPFVTSFATGILSNLTILAVLLAGEAIYRRIAR